MVLQVYADGSLAPGGQGSWGYILVEDDIEIATGSGILVADTPTNAEYIAVIKGLCGAKRAGYQEVEVYNDCTGVINHLSRQAPVHSDRARPLYRKAARVLATFDRADVRHASRDHPLIQQADYLGRVAVARFTGGKYVTLMPECAYPATPRAVEALDG